MSIPFAPFKIIVSSRSLRYMEKRKGDRHSPCLTPILLKKTSLVILLCFTCDFTMLYIDRIMSNILPLTPNFNGLRMRGIGVAHARDSEWMQNFDQHNFTDNFLIFSDPVDFEI